MEYHLIERYNDISGTRSTFGIRNMNKQDSLNNNHSSNKDFSSKQPYLDADPTSFLDYQIQKQIKNLYKEYLFLIEKIFNSHDEFLEKLRSTLPDQYAVYVDLAEFLTDSKYEELRKEILDRGNSTIRSINDELKKYNINFK